MKLFRDVLAPVLTAIMWIAVILIVSSTVSIVYERNELFYIITIGSVILMILTNILWSPKGIELGEKEKDVYNNTKIFDNRANYITKNKLFIEAREFCKKRSQEYHEEVIDRMLSKENLVRKEFDDFKECKEKLLRKEIDKEEFLKHCSIYSKSQIRCMNKIFKGVKTERIEIDDLIRSSNEKSGLRPKNKERIYRNIRVCLKAVWGLLLGLLTVGIILQSKQFGRNECFQLLAWTFAIGMNIFTTIYSCYWSVTNLRKKYLADKNDRLAEFYGYINIDVEDIDKEIEKELK